MLWLRRHRPKIRAVQTWHSVHGYAAGKDPNSPRPALHGYLDRLRADLQPRLSPLVQKAQTTAHALKQLTREVGDSKEALQRASRALNELTGYTQIDAVKQRVNLKAKTFETTRGEVQEAKRCYELAIEQRSATQRGINELLQRKHLWTGDDVTRFTELYRLEHEHSQAEIHAKERYQQCEKRMDREYMDLAHSIMERYHEEQLWSDKIRSVSTYGTWALMVVNLLLFVAVQTIFEPRKRKRLTDRFEELLVTTVEEEETKWSTAFNALDEKQGRLEEQQHAILAAFTELSAPTPPSTGSVPAETVVVDQPLPLPPTPAPSFVLPHPHLLHTASSALAGGVATALAIYFWS